MSIAVPRRLTRAYALSFVVALLMAGASLAGLLAPGALYPTQDLRRAFVPNDAVNLIIGLPCLLGALWAAWRGRLTGLLAWPGALLFVIYNGIAYALAMPLAATTAIYAALVALSLYALAEWLGAQDSGRVRQRLISGVHERWAAECCLAWVRCSVCALSASCSAL